MKKKYKKSLFIFRRDLRLEDNIGLLALLSQSETVLPTFIFDPRQIDPEKNKYFSAPAFQFLLNSLKELNEDLRARGSKLYLFEGTPSEIVESLLVNDDIEAVFVNKDYTPFARTRDKAIADICDMHEVTFERHDDICLSPIEEIRTKDNSLYTVFTPFMKTASGYEVAKPRKNNFDSYYTSTLKTPAVTLAQYTVDTKDMELALSGGRSEALLQLRKNTYLRDYKNRRNIPSESGTSRLSAHHKFGTISIRETYHMAVEKSGKTSYFISELYWRDFYYYIAYHFPHVFKKSFLPWAQHITWINNKTQFKAWCAGKTGVPMVDAGMRQLNYTGWMHNRSRMIVASYLTKNLLIDWQWGEQYFATKLIDYDPAQNNGGWQWGASTGADPRPIRIFNPYTQATKYDPGAIYIKRWVPELRDVDEELLTNGKTQDLSTYAHDYPSPIEDQKTSYRRVLEAYKSAKATWKAKHSTS